MCAKKNNLPFVKTATVCAHNSRTCCKQATAKARLSAVSTVFSLQYSQHVSRTKLLARHTRHQAPSCRAVQSIHSDRPRSQRHDTPYCKYGSETDSHAAQSPHYNNSSNKSAFSFLRQLTTWHCSHLPLNAVLLRRQAATAVNQQFLPVGPTAANPPQRHALVARWDRQTDGHRTVI